MTFKELKIQRYKNNSDINEHLPTLEKFAQNCDHITEFGLRDGNSTIAFIAGCKGEVHSYDINERSSAIKLLNNIQLPCKWFYHKGNTGTDLNIEETDFLFIDTWHTYQHVTNELKYNGRKAKKYLGFHDTAIFATKGESGCQIGINKAIMEFINQYPNEYKLIYQTTKNNGLWIFEKLC